MAKIKVDIASAAEGTGKKAKMLLGKTRAAIVNIADQNNDGSFDMKDVSVIATAIGNAAHNTASFIKSTVEERNLEKERSLLQPVFANDLNKAGFRMSKLIRITEIDKRRAESEICKGSIGYITSQKDICVVNIFRDELDAFGLQLQPSADYEVYYIDPCNSNKYIALDGYFNYLKIAYVNELQKIAQDLGAKHFRVIYKEHESTTAEKTAKTKNSLKLGIKASSAAAERNIASNAVSAVEVAAEMDCPGHEPIEPILCYFRNDLSIKNLICMRMDKKSPLSHQKFTLKLSDSSGIKEVDAVKIDAALKAMKVEGNTSVVNEVQKDSRRFFEYEIDF